MRCTGWLLLVFWAARGSLASCPSPSERLTNLTAWPAYDRAARPNLGSGEPANVLVQLYVAAIANVDQKQQHVSLEGYFRSEWYDPRLAQAEGSCTGTITLTLPGNTAIWQPDIYFDNSLREWYGAGSIEVFPDGRVYRSVRFNHLLRCPMGFEALPFDHQRCFVQMSSYSWDLANINASAFSNGAVLVPDGYDGTTEWQLAKAESEVTTEWFGAGDNRKGYKYVWVYITLARRPSSYMLFVFGTCVLFAIVAWIGLFINRTVAPARVTIAVIPVLIQLNLENSVTQQLPPLNYLTWLTSFLLLMKLFSVSVVLEYGLVAFLMQVETARDRQFAAFKHMADAMKKKAADEEEGILDMERTNQEPQCSPRVFASRKNKLEFAELKPKTGSELKVTAANGDSPCPHLDPAQNMAEVYRVFDADSSGDLGVSEVQAGFRKLGQYLSKDQVHEIFYKLGVDGHKMQPSDFRRLLLNIATYMPGQAWRIHFWERPPSMQVDIAFRYLYITGVLLSTLTWSLYQF